MKKEKSPSFADVICDLRSRKIKSIFFDQVNKLVDWKPLSKLIDEHYSRGKRTNGQAAYPGLLLFKMSLLQTWYGLSDYEVEDRLNDSISFSKFCALPIDSVSPDHSTLSRFRKEMTEKKVYEELLLMLNTQLEQHHIIVKRGAIVDASIVDSPLKPRGTVPYEITKDRDEQAIDEAQEQASKEILKQTQPWVDTEGAWIKKGGKIRYGYKKHVVTDEQGLVLGLITTPANINEIGNLEEVLAEVDLPEGIPLFGDKGYQSAKNNELIKKKKLKNRILKKAVKGKPLTKMALLYNKLCGRTRFKVERTFGSIKRWFNSTCARYKGIAKMHTQNMMEAMAYNLYRCPAIIASNSEK